MGGDQLLFPAPQKNPKNLHMYVEWQYLMSLGKPNLQKICPSGCSASSLSCWYYFSH
jgi:hypothetical protein